MSTLIPITANYYNKDVSGLVLSWASNTTLGTGAGYCLDSNKTTIMNVATALVLNGATTGVNALDTGTLAASTEYYVYIIGNSSAGNDLDSTRVGVGLISLSATVPVLPTGYDIFRRVGVVKTDGSTYFLKFWQTGVAGTRKYEWDEPISVLSGGSSATLASVVCTTACMLADNQPIVLQCDLTPSAANDIGAIVPGNSTASTGKTMSGPVAGKVATAFIETTAQLVSSVPAINYRVTASGALTLHVVSFIDSI